MATSPQTTVHLTEAAQKVKDALAPIYGLKNILSAGLTIFGKLSDSDQKKTIAEANGMARTPVVEKTIQGAPQTLREFFRQIVQKTKEQQQVEMPVMIIKVTPSDKKLWDELDQLVGPEPKKQKKKAGG